MPKINVSTLSETRLSQLELPPIPFFPEMLRWEMGAVKPGGTVASRRHLLDIRVNALSFGSAI